jgi:hypothetical protein
VTDLEPDLDQNANHDRRFGRSGYFDCTTGVGIVAARLNSRPRLTSFHANRPAPVEKAISELANLKNGRNGNGQQLEKRV